MEEAELAAHAGAWVPNAPVNQDMDAHLMYLLTSGSALQIGQQPSGVLAFRDLVRKYIPRSQARSLAQLQEPMHFDFAADVTDRLIVFERLVEKYQVQQWRSI